MKLERRIMTQTILTQEEKDAFEIAWDMFPEADSVYVSEVKSQ